MDGWLIACRTTSAGTNVSCASLRQTTSLVYDRWSASARKDGAPGRLLQKKKSPGLGGEMAHFFTGCPLQTWRPPLGTYVKTAHVTGQSVRRRVVVPPPPPLRGSSSTTSTAPPFDAAALGV